MNGPSAPPKPSSSLEPSTAAVKSRRGFPKSSRILKTAGFRRVYDTGLKYSTRLFAAFYLDQGSRRSTPRAGFTVPRAVGKAVKRNRIKRRIREAVRLELAALDPRWDVVFNPRRGVLDAPFADLRTEVRKLISRCKP